MPFTRRAFLVGASAVPLASLMSKAAFAGIPPVYMNKGIAIDGTDPVAYFSEGKPVPGSQEIAHNWNGAIWHFASPENKAAFAANPVAYAPQYGGYCAYAVSEGYTASTVPNAWKIVDGKLYLNYPRRIQRKWERDIPRRIASADTHWPSLLT
ncbi:MAG: YHS domain-containing (seleno)protein [Roseobacter sp.]